MRIFDSDGLRGCAINQLENLISLRKSQIIHAKSLSEGYFANLDGAAKRREDVLDYEFMLLAIETLLEVLKKEVN